MKPACEPESLPAPALAVLHAVPLTEMPALSLSLLESVLGRALPPSAVRSAPPGPFQSSV